MIQHYCWLPNNVVFNINRCSETDTTTEVTATLELNYYKWDVQGWDVQGWRVFKRYHGKSIRPLKKTRRKKDSNNEKEEMKKEAKKAALMECYKEYFGFTEFNDILVDELTPK